MSREKSQRDIKRFDYKIYNDTGKKVLKDTRKGFVTMANSIQEEMKLVCKVKRVLKEYELSLLFDVEDIEEGLSEVRKLIENYESIHVSLKVELEGDYEGSYKEYDSQIDLMTNWIKDAKMEIRNKKEKRRSEETEMARQQEEVKKEKVKQQEEEMKEKVKQEDEDRKGKVTKAKNKVIVEEKYFRDKIKQEIENMYDEDSFFIDDIERNIGSVKELIQGLSELFFRIEEFGQEFRNQFGNLYEEQSHTLNLFIRNMRKRIQNIKLTDLKTKEDLKNSVENEQMKREKMSKIAISNNLYDNVCERFSSLEGKCDSKIEDLTDIQVLENRKDVKTFDSEFNEILDRITKLSESNPSEFTETSDLMEKIEKRKKSLKVSIDLFKTNLEKEITDRDLSKEKMKNASILGIKLQRFKGYDSAMDYYTFKSEFEKLIAPRVQAKLLPDYLKNNYLDGHALQLVKEIDDLGDIWERLKTSFGNVVTLLSNKLEELEKSGPLWKIRNEEKLVQSIIKIKNSMMELRSLAEKHNIQQNLFHTSNLAKIFHILGRKRQVDITKKLLDANKNDQEKWDEIIKYLDRELKLKEQLLLFEKSNPKVDENLRNKRSVEGGSQIYSASPPGPKKCVICEKLDHIPTITNKGNAVINYFACEKFVKMNPKERFEELKRKKLCFQCLTPGLKVGHEGRCFDKYKCPDESHNRHRSGLHVLICDRHKNKQENLELLEVYKSKCIIGSNNSHAEFSKGIGIAFHVDPGSYDVGLTKSANNEDSDMAIYMLQTIRVGNKNLNLFFDSGCGDMVCRKSAVDVLAEQKRAKNIVDGPLILSGVGDKKTVCDHGRFQITIPLHDGKNVNLSGICLDKITSTFPSYPLNEVESDIRQNYVSVGGDVENLPKLPKSVGGDTDIMLGIQYLKYFPKEVHKLPNGLAIFESQFISPDGSRGIVGGPHERFTDVHKRFNINHVNTSAYSAETQAYLHEHRIGLDMALLDVKVSEMIFDDVDNSTQEFINDQCMPHFEGQMGFDDVLPKEGNSEESKKVYVNKRVPKCVKNFEKVEKAGTEASYRCIKCRGCSTCKKSEIVECISLQEEVEQGLIEKSVTVNLLEGFVIAYLPFLCDPTKKLSTNKYRSEKIYYSQVKMLNSKPEDKQDIKDAMKKLINLGFVASFDSLTEEQKFVIDSSPVKYYIPWMAVWNTNSISTPCRPVFNASCPTNSGYSLNDLLPKGRNNLNNLVQIFLRWLIYVCAFHTDIQKMYNTIRLTVEHWCYQLFLWENELDLNVKPLVYVIQTLIYGVRTSGNQAERGVRETANLCKDEYPRQHEIVQKDIYVDDCFSGENTYEKAKEVTDDLQIVLSKGGFRLKGVTFAGFDPPDHLSNDDKSVNVAGMKWFPKPDLMTLNLGDLNFGKKVRGKKSEKLKGLIPDKFTRRECAGRVGEIFDLIGRFTPLIAEFKLDLSELSTRKLEWDDVVPDDLVFTWKSNFEKISKMREIKFKRCIVPEDAVSLDMETIEMADSSLNMACSAIYARFKRKNGLHSCQLIFARSKIIPDGMSIPRAELFAATLNATTGHVVNLALGKYIKDRINLTDSQIALFWINNTQAQLKQWVRNRVIEINRLTDRDKWYYIDSSNMTADIGTRRGAKISDVSENSPWINGHEWAKYDKETFPIKSVKDIKFSKEEIKGHSDEILKLNVSDSEWIDSQLSDDYCKNYVTINEGVLNKIGQRYKFSNYIVDPNKFRFRKIVRIVALVLLFVKNLKRKIGKSTIVISENKVPDQLNFCNDKYLVTDEKIDFPFKCSKGLVIELSEVNLSESLNYFYKKASLEVKYFQNKNSYEKISTEKFGILYYTGRILPSQKFDNKLNLSDVCIDLSISSFCVPLVDKHSPLAYALINEVHWYDDDARHSGNETVMRYVQKLAHIFEGRSLVKLFRNECPRCRYLNKKAIEVAMGPKSCDNFSIAPAFYVSQVDLFGPYNSYSNLNKRATAKVWFVIFCCCVTGAVDIKVTEDYSTSSFILAFIRFSCKVGYPRKLLPDAGSQLVKGCESMKITFSDVRNKLHEYGVEFEVCPVGAHYMHGKVERKIKHVKESFSKHLNNNRLSIIQWETLGDKVANSINNLPIAIGNVTKDLENLDLLTPNRLLLARNNSRCPVGSVIVTEDVGKIIPQNNAVFEAWFRAWLTSYVPTLMFQPKWFRSDVDPKVGDVVMFLKSDKDFEKLYQYGIICDLKKSRDGKIRQVEVEYQNHTEKVKRRTNRGTREIVIIHPYDELGLVRELNILSASV